MKNQKVTGIGCYADLRTLDRVFNKIVRTYALDSLADIGLKNENRTVGRGASGLLHALVAQRREKSQSRTPQSGRDMKNGQITGFFLQLKGQSLHLWVFAKGDRPGENRYTACLDELAKIRQHRLN